MATGEKSQSKKVIGVKKIFEKIEVKGRALDDIL